MSVLNYLFYALYKWSEKVNAKDDDHLFATVCMCGSTIILNLLLLLLLLYEAGVTVAPLASVPRFFWIAMGATFYALLYWYFKSNYRYKKILNHFEAGNENNSAAWVGISYVLVSFGLLVILAWVFLD